MVWHLFIVDAVAHVPMALTANASVRAVLPARAGRVEKGDVVAVVARDAQHLTV